MTSLKLSKTIYFVEMRSPAEESLFDGNIFMALTLACMRIRLQKRKFYTKSRFSVTRNLIMKRKTSVSTDCHKKYINTVSSHLVLADKKK